MKSVRVPTFKIAMATFGAKFLEKIDKSKTQDCKRNLSPTILKGKSLGKSQDKDILAKRT